MKMEMLFNKKIYTQKALKGTADAFGQLAEFKIGAEGDYYKVSVTKLLDDEVESSLMDEFANYALYTTVAEMKKWQ